MLCLGLDLNVQPYKDTFNIQVTSVGITIDPPFAQGSFPATQIQKYTTKILTDPLIAQIFLHLMQIFHQSPTNRNKIKYEHHSAFEAPH
jgi:hypothetical protein